MATGKVNITAVVDDCVSMIAYKGMSFVNVFVGNGDGTFKTATELSFEYDRRHVHRVRGFERLRQAIYR